MIRSGDIQRIIDVRAVGHRVRECRQARGWRIGDLAKRAGMDKSVLCLLERGLRGTSMENWAAISLALRRPLEWILSGERSLKVAWKRHRENLAA